MFRSADFSTMLGIIAAFGLIGGAILIGGSPTAFLDLPSALIVIGATLSVTTACFSLQEIWLTKGVIFRAMFHRTPDISKSAIFAMSVADYARKEGVLALERYQDLKQYNNLFFRKGVSLLVDGNTGEHVEKILALEMASTAERHAKAASILRKAGEISPAMGLIGTLIGLVQMLGDITNPSVLGPAMAVALLTTLYGALLAYVVLFPIASKLERNSKEEMLANRIYLRTVVSIARQENPRQLQILINSLLPHSKRIHYFQDT